MKALLSTLLITLISLSVFAQKMPFQGQLLENGTPVTGSKDFVFTIPDGEGGTLWTETLTGVAVQDGLYSVVLGSTTPLPVDLFATSVSRSLAISIDGQALTPVDVYAAASSPNYTLEIGSDASAKDASVVTLTGAGADNQIYRSLVGVSSLSKGVQSGVTGESVSSSTSTNNSYGVFGSASGASTTGQHRGVYGQAISPEGSSASQFGIYGRTLGQGTGAHFAIYGESLNSPLGRIDNFGAFTTVSGQSKLNVGVYGNATGVGSGDPTEFQNGIFGSYNFGVRGEATNNLNGNIGVYGWVYGNTSSIDNVGVVGRSQIDDGSTVIENTGLYGDGRGPGINRGVWGVASGGTENWAGWFDGDVKVTGNLILDNPLEATIPEQVRKTFNNGDPQGQVLHLIAEGPGSEENVGLLIESKAESGISTGVWAITSPGSSNNSEQYPIYGAAVANGSGNAYGASGDVGGNGTGERVGLFATVRGTGATTSYGTRSSNSVTTGDNVWSWGGFFENRGTGNATSNNIGLEGKATKNAGINVGVKGIATGGTENWAGWFEGDVKVTNSIQVAPNDVTDQPTATFKNADIAFDGPDGEINSLLGFNFLDGGAQGANRGALFMWGDIATRTTLNNQDIRRVDLRVADDGFGKDIGKMTLRGPFEGDNRMVELGGYSTDGGTSYLGSIELRGSNGESFTIDANGIGGGNVSATQIRQDYGGFGRKDWEGIVGMQGFMDLRGDAPEGKDNIRVGMGVDRNAAGETYGNLNLFGPVYNNPGCATCPRGFLSASVGKGDPNGFATEEWSGRLELSGQESPNVILTSDGYNDSDMGRIELYGNKPNGNGWWYDHASMSVAKDGDQNWGTLRLNANEGVPNIELGGKPWEGTGMAGRPLMNMRGTVQVAGSPDPYYPDLIRMEVNDGGSSTETGFIRVASTDGKGATIDGRGSLGLNGTNNQRVHMGTMADNAGNGTDLPYFFMFGQSNGNSEVDFRIQNDGDGDYGRAIFKNNSNGNEVSIHGSDGSINTTGNISGGNSLDLPKATLQSSWGNNGQGALELRDANNQTRIQASVNDDGSSNYNGHINLTNSVTSGFTTLDGQWGIRSSSMIAVSQGSNQANNSIEMGDNLNSGFLNVNDASNFNIITLNGSNGSINAVTVTATTVNQTSDSRLKENIRPLENSLHNTLQLRGVSYNWIDKAKSQSTQIGVIAQEVEEVYPEFVHTNEEGMKSVNYSQMVAVLIEAIKELNTQIETLKTENASLKAELATASNNEKRITELEASVKSLVNLLQAPSKPSDANNTSIGKQE